MGPTLLFSDRLHQEKYRNDNETFKEAMNRVAGALTDDNDKFHKFRDALLNMRFLPGGRIQSAIGTTKNCTSHNCFVSAKIEDSFVDGPHSIMQTATEAAATMRMGGGIGFDFSTLRPRGDLIHKLNSYSTGPVSFMEIYNSICLCVASSGHRRGAMLGLLRVDHPDIEEFIHAKQPPHEAEPVLQMLSKCKVNTPEWYDWFKVLQSVYSLTGFNLSIGITDRFMEAVKEGNQFKLKFKNKIYREVDARALWDTIMRSAWDWGEPGVLFIDHINNMNNLWYSETIYTCNVCGEQPLPEYGSCLLGSFNLVKYIIKEGDRWYFDYDLLKNDIPHVVEAMDNVTDKSIFTLPQQRDVAKNSRRMGLGVTGAANAIEAMGFPYGSPEFIETLDKILNFIKTNVYKTSVELAKVKGPFPLFDKEQYMQGKFIQTLDEEVQELIAKHGIRNSHLTSIAPTGTISICADNVSSGIEPVFAWNQKRLVNMKNGSVEVDVDDYGVREFGVYGKRCSDVTVDEHLNVLITASKHVDSAISKTCNVPPTTPWDEFKNIYMRAWEAGCKGITTFQTGGKRSGIIESADESACRIDPVTGRHECE